MRLAAEMAFDEVEGGRLALVVTELGNNLFRHAQRGRILLAARTVDPGRCVEVLSLDHGPGMANVNDFMRDGFSTSGTPGTGMGAVRRLADEFSIFSLPAKGTVVVARILTRGAAAHAGRTLAAPGFAVGAVCLAAPGETVCGDAWSVRVQDHRARVLVADGLGHGPIAEEAASTAVRVFESAAEGGPSQVLERAHQVMKGTRGAAVAMAELDAREGSIVFSGAGNIAGRLISGVEDRSLLSQHGTAGLQIRRLQDIRYEWSEHAMLILHSDGIVSRWNLGEARGLLQCDPCVVAGWLVRDHFRGRDDATVVAIRRR
jgi:anti-sigma regulatory factor (Ser/Thr protein kinase)